MQIKRLILTNVRVFERAEFDFQPGMNLLVGINGAGKSTVLDVLRIMFSQSLPKFTASQETAQKFSPEDNRYGQSEPELLEVRLDFEIGKFPVSQIAKFNRMSLRPRASIIATEFEEAEQSLVVYFSTRRSIVDYRLSGTGISPQLAKTQDPPIRFTSDMHEKYLAYHDALVSRELRLSAFAEWWVSRVTLGLEDESLSEVLEHIETAITTFLPDCHEIREERDQRRRATLLLEKGSTTLDIRQLSDGERSIIAMVFDLARRLVLANPESRNPIQDGKAVVLIDELDLHLHPSWQRTIIDRLTKTFPQCQFIATTHSPQIIGEVRPEQVILIENGTTYRPSQSLGMDINWIVRHIMGDLPRKESKLHELNIIEELIENEEYDEAAAAIERLRAELGDFPELVSLQTRIDMIEFLDDEEDDAE